MHSNSTCRPPKGLVAASLSCCSRYLWASWMSRAEAEVILSVPHSCPPHSFTAPSLPLHNPSIFRAPAARAIKLWKIKTKERKKYNMFAQICLTSVRALLPTNRVCETLIGWPAYTCLSWQPPPGGRETHRERERENWDLANVPRLEKCSATDVEVSGGETATQDWMKSWQFRDER